jgi:hypothetical protein
MFARSFRTMLVVATVALSAVPAAAYADGTKADGATERDRHGRIDEKEKAFPVATPVFKDRIEKRLATIRTRTEARLEKSKLPLEARKAVLAKLDEGSRRVLGDVDKVGAGGTVSKEGAREVRQAVMRVVQEARSSVPRAHGHRPAKPAK